MISARRELTEEFYEKSGGKTFHLINPKDFIIMYKPNVNEQVKEDLDKPKFLFWSQNEFSSPFYENIRTYYKKFDNNKFDSVISRINEILYFHDIFGIAHISGDQQEYLTEAKTILEYFPKVNSEKDMEKVIIKIFSESLNGLVITEYQLEISILAEDLCKYKLELDKIKWWI